MKKKLVNFLIWINILTLMFLGVLGTNFGKIKADDLATVQFDPQNINSSGPKTLANPSVKIILSNGPLREDVVVDYMINWALTTADESDFSLGEMPVTISAGNASVKLPFAIFDNHKTEAPKKIVIDLTGVETPGVVLGEETEFTYTLYSTPKSGLVVDAPDGANGWYKSTPQIDFVTYPDDAQTFYQWNSTQERGWQEFTSFYPPTAVNGQNTLYYKAYETVNVSDNSVINNSSAVYAQLFKIDTVAPKAPTSIKASFGEDNQIHLGWVAAVDTISGVATYHVHRLDSNKTAVLNSKEFNYVDANVKPGQSYQYQVWATDYAGNLSGVKAFTMSAPAVFYTPKVAVEKAATTSPRTTSQSKKDISFGSQTSQTPNNTISQKPKEVKAAEKTNPTTETSNKNWNKLLLAVSILIIAAGAALGGYYGYEWWIDKKGGDSGKMPPKSKSRW